MPWGIGHRHRASPWYLIEISGEPDIQWSEAILTRSVMALQVLETGKGPGASLAVIGLGAHGSWLRVVTFPLFERWQVEEVGEGSSNSADQVPTGS